MIFGRYEVLNEPYKINGSDHKNKSIINLKLRHNFGTAVIPLFKSSGASSGLLCMAGFSPTNSELLEVLILLMTALDAIPKWKT